MVILYSGPSAAQIIFFLFFFGLVCGLAGGLLAWLVGAAWRPGRLGLGPMLGIGAGSGVVFLFAAVWIEPLIGTGRWPIGDRAWLVLPIIASALVALAANAWHSRRRR